MGMNSSDNKDSETIEQYVQIFTEAVKGDTRRAFLYGSVGDNSVPLGNERFALIKVDGTGKYATVAVLMKSQGALPGEKILYSRDPDGEIAAMISMLNDKSIELRGNVEAMAGSFTCTGKVTPDGTGALCGISRCYVSNAFVSGSVAEDNRSEKE
jgi:hypothetical protein